MAIEYTVSQDGRRIETFPKGALNFKETFDYFDRLKNDDRIKQGATEIVYFRDTTDFIISYLESDRIVMHYGKVINIKKIIATIFVCETTQAYVIGRMLQTFHEIINPDHKVVTVRSEGGIEKAINEL